MIIDNLKTVLLEDFTKTDNIFGVVPDFGLILQTGRAYHITGRVTPNAGYGGWRMKFDGGDVVVSEMDGGVIGFNGADAFVAGSHLPTLSTVFGTPEDETTPMFIDMTVKVAQGGLLAPQFAKNADEENEPSTLLKYATLQAVNIA